MVTSVNKWFLVSLVGLFMSLNISATKGNSGTPPYETLIFHPLHVSTTEINHNATEKTLEITCRIFTDDFESILSKLYHSKADLSSPGMKTEMDSLVKKYLSSHLQIKSDGKPVTMNYLGFEKEDAAVNVYFEADKISAVKKVDVTDNILHDLYDDQIEIIHVIVNGNRKSTKLDYPAKNASFSF